MSYTEPGRYWPAVLGAIVLVGFLVRLWGLVDVSFAHDEASMARFSEGILKLGLPTVTNGGYKKWLTTYELVPYPMALSSLILGQTVFAYRLPALIFGSLTVGLVGWVGYRIFDWRTALVSALIYAFLPSPIQWARDGFYPSQDCFFAVLTFWFFYEALRSENGLNHRYVALSCVGFLLTYLSWEGSGFILPTLFVLLIVMTWGRFGWIRDRYLWLMAMLTSAAVVTQLCIRELLLTPNYLGVGYDLSEVSTPSPVFLNRVIFQPLYYLKGFLLSENHTVLTLLAFGALFAGRRHRGLRYVSTSVFMLEFWYTFFLPKYGPRYTFNVLPLLDLAAVGFFFQIADRIADMDHFSRAAAVRLIQSSCVGLLLIVFCLSSNPYLLKPYRLASDPTEPFYFERVGVQFKPNYRDADQYVARHFQRGDVIMTREPHVFEFYTGIRPKFSTDTLWNSRTFYDGRRDPPRYIDKWYGLPSLMSFQEILDTRMRSPTIWIIKSTGCRREFDFQGRSYLKLWGRTEFETTCEEVVSLRGVSPDLQKSFGQPDE
jgi:Dolichyl-phosphate-mannose-protein mannosyltransferase